MKRLLLSMLILAAPGAALARDNAFYYGPMQRWHGFGYKFGYEDRVERDGSWRIDTAIHGQGEAVDMAMYRAAERAREAGFRYIFFLGGKGWRSPGINAATIYARPSHDAVPPTSCRSKKLSTCYTADVAEVLRVLGGPDGMQPGVAIVDHRDQFGREVTFSGYGIGAVSASASASEQRRQTMIITDGTVQIRTTSVVPMSPPQRYAPAALPSRPAAPMMAAVPDVVGSSSGLSSDERLQKALKEAQSVHGGDRKQGWTISD
jgi:hypothetical protein